METTQDLMKYLQIPAQEKAETDFGIEGKNENRKTLCRQSTGGSKG